MAEANFDACIEVVLVYEGGLSMIRADPGNWTGGRVGRGTLRGTKYGIAASAHPTLDIANLTLDGAKAIYRSEYWNKIWGDTLTAGVDLVVLDAAVNSGPAKALRWLSQAQPDAPIRLARFDAPTSLAVIDAVCAKRLSFLHALGTWRAFGRGWGARVADVEAKAHRMVLGSGAAANALIRAKGTLHQGRAARGKATAGTSGSLGIVGAAGSTASGGLPHTVIILGLMVALAGAGVLAFVAWRDAQRATALKAEADATPTPATTHPVASKP